MICTREGCEGQLIAERYVDNSEDGNGDCFSGLRCTSCGDIIDDVILVHRSLCTTQEWLDAAKLRKKHTRIKISVTEGEKRELNTVEAER